MGETDDRAKAASLDVPRRPVPGYVRHPAGHHDRERRDPEPGHGPARVSRPGGVGGNSYLLVFTALLIVASRLGDIFGPRRLFVGGLAVFALASALCGAAQSPGQLIAARVL